MENTWLQVVLSVHKEMVQDGVMGSVSGLTISVQPKVCIFFKVERLVQIFLMFCPEYIFKDVSNFHQR